MPPTSTPPPPIRELGDEACAGVKVLSSPRDSALSSEVPISKPRPAVREQASDVTGEGEPERSAGTQDYFITKDTRSEILLREGLSQEGRALPT